MDKHMRRLPSLSFARYQVSELIYRRWRSWIIFNQITFLTFLQWSDICVPYYLRNLSRQKPGKKLSKSYTFLTCIINKKNEIIADPTMTLFDSFFSRKVQKLRTWNFDKIFIEVFNLCYQNWGSLSLMVWKLYAFRQRSNFGNCQQFFHHNFRLKGKFWTLMVSWERSSWDLL